jgi:hypothetical protein
MSTAPSYLLPKNDREYRAWLSAHAGGFVLNVRETFSPSYMVLHRAGCPHISTHSNPGAFTERAYRKVCAETPAPLASWARQHGRADGSFSHRCRTCSPV